MVLDQEGWVVLKYLHDTIYVFGSLLQPCSQSKIESPPALFISLSIKCKILIFVPQHFKQNPFPTLPFNFPSSTKYLMSPVHAAVSQILYQLPVSECQYFLFSLSRTTYFQIGAWFVTLSLSSLCLNIIFLVLVIFIHQFT